LYVEFIKVDLPVPVGFWRSVGKSHNAFVVESFIDELAFAVKSDPIEFRLQHLSKHKRAKDLLQFVADKIKWSNNVEDFGYGIALLFGYDSYVVEAAKVRLDNATGNYKIDKIIAGVDCGNVINPQIVKDQILSGIIMGLSAALKEKMEFKNGGPAVENFFNYNILSQLDVPNIEVYIIESDEKVGGIGEAGLPLAAPAVVNAIFDLTGIRYRNLPLTLNI
jgi:isoquinoline 1-oxidoreductase beta subunit